jgi:AcrR family transcriptional regulator
VVSVVRTKTPAQADKIIEAAAHLFGTQRFHEVRMEDIAVEARVGKGTLYRYFRDKEELYVGLLDRALEQFTAEVRAAADGAAGPREGLEALVGAVIGYFDRYPHLMGLIQRAELAHEADTPFLWEEARAEVLRLIIRLFDEGRACGAFEVRDPELAAMMLLGGLRTVIRAGPRPRPADLCRRVVAGLLWGAATLVTARGAPGEG